MKTILLITLLEGLAGALLMVLWSFRRTHSETLARVTAGSIASRADDPGTELTRRDGSRWVFINSWKVTPQSDDRRPMLGDVAYSTASPSLRRSTARRRHQAMYKEWSQGRHD